MTRARPRRRLSGWPPAVLFLLLACAPEQRFASLGDFVLESGEVIRDCRIGYRAFGELDAARSNAVLVAPWATGTSRELSRQIASGSLLDPSGRFVIAVDALGNGVSSSPSNSVRQPGSAFPRFSMRDVVESQHRLLARVLGVSHLQAVVGISAGGMQAFQWAAAYPEFLDKAISIAGSPRSSPRDKEQWRALADEIRREPGWKRGLWSLARVAPRDALGHLRIDAEDFDRQARAIAGLDVSAPFGGSMARASGAVRAKLLVIVSERDEMVDPAPALEFARLAGAEVLVLDGRCGHRAASCESEAIRGAVARFLSGEPRSASR
jgi:homoserine O-acetyltransferase/O-succinyltransferase